MLDHSIQSHDHHSIRIPGECKEGYISWLSMPHSTFAPRLHVFMILRMYS